jgi:hypothetical protein
MDRLRKAVILIHYNIWRFERWWRRLIFGNGKLISITSSQETNKELDDFNPFSLHNELPNYSGKHFSILLCLFLWSFWNLFSGLIRVDSYGVWPAGLFFVGFLGFVVDHYLSPSDREEYLVEFIRLEITTESEKRRSALLTFFLVIAIYSVFIASLAFYLKSLLRS